MTIPSQRIPLIQLFHERNDKINLSSFSDEETIYHKHIDDSLRLLDFIQLLPNTVCFDIGTGWWFPLLPLAIANPLVSFFGMDSTRKKLIAVQDIADRLRLSNVQTIWSRAEEYRLKKADYITARAVAHGDTLIPNISHLIKPWWSVFLYKQPSEDEHIALLNSPYLNYQSHHDYVWLDGIQKRIYHFLWNKR